MLAHPAKAIRVRCADGLRTADSKKIPSVKYRLSIIVSPGGSFPGRHEDLAERIRWHGPEREFLGWDITSFNNDGTELFIEVKSCVGKMIATVALTVNEWEAACDEKRRDRYCIYVVTRCSLIDTNHRTFAQSGIVR